MSLPFICRHCLTRPFVRPFTCTLTTTAPPPPATSTSAAQPFSTPFTTSPALKPLTPGASASSSSPSDVPTHGVTGGPVGVKSSVPAGMPLKGLGYLKRSETPVALEDWEYPAWLWGLDVGGKKDVGKEGGEGDAFAKSKKQRRLASKSLKKTLAAHPEALEPKVPLEHQSIDLESGDGSAGGNVKAGEQREELRGAMRRARRKGIKEGNFLKAM